MNVRLTPVRILRIVIVICVGGFFNTSTRAQFPADWGHAGVGPSSICYDLHLKDQNKLYSVGEFFEEITFGNITLQSASSTVDGYISVMDTAGNVEQSLAIVGDAYDAVVRVVSTEDRIIVGGRTKSSNLDIDPDPTGTYTLNNSLLLGSSVAPVATFIAVYDTNFNVINGFIFGDTAGWATITDLELGDSGEIWISGVFSGTIDFDPTSTLALHSTSLLNAQGFLARYDYDGNLLFFGQTSGNATNYINSIETLDNGSILVAGSFEDSADLALDLGTITNYQTVPYYQKDVFIAVYDSTGAIVWLNHFGDLAAHNFAIDVALDKWGNFYLAAETEGTSDVGGGCFTSGYNNSITLVKYGSSGICEWAGSMQIIHSFWSWVPLRQMGRMAIRDSSVYITYRLPDTIDFDIGDCGTHGVGYASPSSGSSNRADVFVAEYCTDGNFVSANAIKGPFVAEASYAIEVDTTNSLYVGGVFGDTLELDSANGLSLINTTSGTHIRTAFVVRYTDTTKSCAKLKILEQSESFKVCELNTTDTSVFVTAKGRGSLSYQWFLNGSEITGATDSSLTIGSISAGDTGWYHVVITDSCNSIISQHLHVGVESLKAAVLVDTVCNSRVSPSGKYTWIQSGEYTDTLTSINGCDSLVLVNLTVYQGTNMVIWDSVCNAALSPSGEQVWSTSGIYYDTLSTMHGCDSTFIVHLLVDTAPTVSMIDTICERYISPSGRHLWTESGTYLDTIFLEEGCDSIFKIVLTKEPEQSEFCSDLMCEVIFPNVMTPNGDGLNDVFGDANDCEQSGSITIYNRWGQILWTSVGVGSKWDGFINGVPASHGIYFYTYESDFGRREGSFSIIGF